MSRCREAVLYCDQGASFRYSARATERTAFLIEVVVDEIRA